MAEDLVEPGDLNHRMDDDAPGIQRISGFRRECACQPDHQRHLDGSRERLPPDEYLSILNASLRIFHAVFRKVFNKSNACAHVEEQPCQVEELGHASPDSQCLSRWQYIGGQDQVLVNDERDEQKKPDGKCNQESTRTVDESRRLPMPFPLRASRKVVRSATIRSSSSG